VPGALTEIPANAGFRWPQRGPRLWSMPGIRCTGRKPVAPAAPTEKRSSHLRSAGRLIRFPGHCVIPVARTLSEGPASLPPWRGPPTSFVGTDADHDRLRGEGVAGGSLERRRVTHHWQRQILHEICQLIDSPPERRPPSVMSTMSDASTTRPSAAAIANTSPARPTPRAVRYACCHCHTHTVLVLRIIGEARCSVCDSYDLAPVED
jgi:hypothetical protein